MPNVSSVQSDRRKAADALARGERRGSQFLRAQGAAGVPFAPASMAETEVDPF
ncbi:hypothetical protein GL4_2782 [Methyloceanibacter caenitepidi]|uniref:Uncharacterized protein n=1 Tax=Methyloceanibacter caenitepidi TaxID=1384459 RepID=A0A0A8K5X8_9HYPH|nr:hypothetical protein GL4_2782 [Methyloceanibacter caenitepidi]